MKRITAEQQLTMEEYVNKYFPIVKVSRLSLNSEFLNYEPVTEAQKRLRDLIIFAIISELPDFRAQVMDPSIDKDGEIYYKAGMKPATALSANCWRIKAEWFMPERESRLGNVLERAAFLGLLIEDLINEQNYHKSLAWRAICDQSTELGNYIDSQNSEGLECTGKRKIGQWYDLSNTQKIVHSEVLGFFLFGGSSLVYGKSMPLSHMMAYDAYPNAGYGNSLGWIVLPKV